MDTVIYCAVQRQFLESSFTYPLFFRPTTEKSHLWCCSRALCTTPSRNEIPKSTRTPPSKTMETQKREVRAWRQSKLHNFILSESRKISSVSRNDHRIMLRTLVSEARRNDPNRPANEARWKHIASSVDLECRNASSIMSIAPDPYSSAVAKLSSMMIWNDECIRLWQYKYNEHEIARRRANQTKTLAALQQQGGLFLKASSVSQQQHVDPTNGLQWFRASRSLINQP
ncbi:Hypothetical protein, putative [Bodo saltans]|uniref:Uncharacterized protein n=1 Tax=Bodo saltans TaxID=75058 RepID=A0A0S4JLM6_BODSA|nr:Hypothetical protein, putative [Bodo saltans]|eukprot:CUG91111.1 Hypothetical protein, putative [Bodo saltans]